MNEGHSAGSTEQQPFMGGMILKWLM